jgi:hypothetical protein
MTRLTALTCHLPAFKAPSRFLRFPKACPPTAIRLPPQQRLTPVRKPPTDPVYLWLAAARHGDVAALKQMWSSGVIADLEVADKGCSTALHHAAFQNQKEACDWLLDQGADIHRKNLRGRNPVRLAGNGHHLPLVRHLVSRGADLHANSRFDQCFVHDMLNGPGRLRENPDRGPLVIEFLEYLETEGFDVARKRCFTWKDTECEDPVSVSLFWGRLPLPTVQWVMNRIGASTWSAERAVEECASAFSSPQEPGVREWLLETFAHHPDFALLQLVQLKGPQFDDLWAQVPEEDRVEKARACLPCVMFSNPARLPFLLDVMGEDFSAPVGDWQITVLGSLVNDMPEWVLKLSPFIRDFNGPAWTVSEESVGEVMARRCPHLLDHAIARGLDLNASVSLSGRKVPLLLAAALRQPPDAMVHLQKKGAKASFLPPEHDWAAFGLLEMALFNPNLATFRHVLATASPSPDLARIAVGFIESCGNVAETEIPVRIRTLVEEKHLSLLDRTGSDCLAGHLLARHPESLRWVMEDDHFSVCPRRHEILVNTLSAALRQDAGKSRSGETSLFLQLWALANKPAYCLPHLSSLSADFVAGFAGQGEVWDQMLVPLMLNHVIPVFDCFPWWALHAATPLGCEVLSGLTPAHNLSGFWDFGDGEDFEAGLGLRRALLSKLQARGLFPAWQKRMGKTLLNRAMKEGFATFSRLVEEFPDLVACRNNAGQTLMHRLWEAPASDHRAMMTLLLAHHLDPWVRDHNGRTAFMELACHGGDGDSLAHWHETGMVREEMEALLPRAPSPRPALTRPSRPSRL